MPLVLPLLIDLAVDVSFIGGVVLGVRVAMFYYKFIRRSL